MAKSTTERDTPEKDAERADLPESDDRHAVELEKQPPGDDVVAESATESAAEPDGVDEGADDAIADPERPGKKRGRRARRAAAAARAEADSEHEAETGEAAAAETKSKPARAGRGRGRAKAGPAKAGAATAGTSKDGTGKGASKRGTSGSSSGRGVSASRVARAIVVLGVIVVLLAAVLVIEWAKGPGNGGKLAKAEDRRESARQAAQTVVPRLFSYDYRQIDANIAEQENLTLGAINDQIRTQTAPALKSLAPKTTAVVQAVAQDAAVVSDDANGVQVLVFLDQAVTSNLLSAPRLDRNRIVATMQQVPGGQWKVADLKAL